MKQLHELFSPHQNFGVKYFAQHYNALPLARTYIAKIDSEKLFGYLQSRYQDGAIALNNNKNFRYKQGQDWILTSGIVFAHLANNVVIHFEDDFLSVCYDKGVSEIWLADFESDLKDLTSSNDLQSRFSMIKKSEYEGYAIADFNIKNSEISLVENYNDDLILLNNGLLDFIKKPDQSGIVLFHGEPGTGKTSYLRYLIANSTTRFIYIPNNLFAHLSDPEFITFISTFSESVIVLEDCEELLKKRESMSSSSGISTLLNLGDGLLGDALKLKIICTFNCPISMLDSAIMRKGRMIYRYEFRKLAAGKVKAILEKLNLDTAPCKEMSLADVYNYQHLNNSISDEKRPVGFSLYGITS